MTLNPARVGALYPTSEPYEVSREKIREYARAIKDENPAYFDQEAAKALGYPDVIAPPSFPMIISLEAERQVVHDPELGARDQVRFVHREQRFAYRRPIVAGDVITAAVRIANVTEIRGNDVIVFETTIATPEGEHVCTAKSTFVMYAATEEAVS
jgi:acyl dehydratase